MKLKEIIDRTTQFFKDKNFDSPRLDAELLIAHGLKLERMQLYINFDRPLKEEELEICRSLVKRRVQGEPVAYILGYKHFFNDRFIVNSSTLIPRPETEHVVEEALAWAKAHNPQARVLDLGTGTGCIGLSLIKALPEARLISVDVSEGALEVASQNAQALGVSDRVEFIHGDAAEKEAQLPKDFDLIVSNPPYIGHQDTHVEVNVKKFEPNSALFADDNGLKFLKTWSEKYRTHLKSKSMMLMEMGFDQGPAMKSFYETLGFDEVKIIKDLSGHDRVICGVKHG